MSNSPSNRNPRHSAAWALRNGPRNAFKPPPERWPSGRWRTLGKRVGGEPSPGFESLSLRQLVLSHGNSLRSCLRRGALAARRPVGLMAAAGSNASRLSARPPAPPSHWPGSSLRLPPSSTSSARFSSSRTGSEAARISSACRKSSTRNCSTFGESTIAGR